MSMDRCPRKGCFHQQYVHALELHGPNNTKQRAGACQVDGCPCPAWDTSIERERAAFVEDWRAKNPTWAHGAIWTCPLCNKVIQEPYAAIPIEWSLEEFAEEHRQAHGADWQRFQAIGAKGEE